MNAHQRRVLRRAVDREFPVGALVYQAGGHREYRVVRRTRFDLAYPHMVNIEVADAPFGYAAVRYTRLERV